MQNTLSEKIRIATQDLRLTDDSQRKIVAHRLTRALLKIDAEQVTVEELRQLISRALVGVPGVVSYAVKPAKKATGQAPDQAVAAVTKPPAGVEKPVAGAEKPAVVEVGEDAYRRNHVVKQVGNG
ncbi:MAG: hypothetical protein KDI04_02910 [Halieaceae bacterium]|nr:hypothetical protein [Halieaceae bacterium]MCP5148209.1 hypothetical protein [Pseudomonadales bacterium]MCP5188288.1 hypothetical protein [Pseudomonadales bacterium]